MAGREPRFTIPSVWVGHGAIMAALAKALWTRKLALDAGDMAAVQTANALISQSVLDDATEWANLSTVFKQALNAAGYDDQGNPVAAPPTPAGGLWTGERAPIVDWPGRYFDAPFREAVCYAYRFTVDQPPYIDASPIVRGSVAIQPDYRATLLCKVSEAPYDLNGWQGEQGPANGVWDSVYGWDPSYAGKTLYLNFAIGRGFGDRTLRVEVFKPTHGVRNGNT